jgi:hypothetical protein
MSNTVKELLDSLNTYMRGDKDAWKPTINQFAEINGAQLANDLSLAQRGAERMQAVSVQTDENGLDAVERSIVEEIRQRARIARNDFNARIDLYEARLREASIGAETFVRIKAAAEEGLSNFEAQVVEDVLPLKHEWNKAGQVCRQFNHFVHTNALKDVAPEVRTKREIYASWCWVTAVALVESILNGRFFAMGSEAGLIGGITEALLLSVLNITLAALIGLFACRYLRHVSWLWKLVAASTLVTLIAAVLALNLLIAHYRDAFVHAQGGLVDFSRVLDRLVNAPTALSDAKSWLLAMLGLVLNGIAIFKFYGMYDPYPGYGKLAARKDAAIESLASLRIGCIATLTAHRDVASEDMRKIISAISARKHDFEVALRGRERLHSSFMEYLEALDGMCVNLGMIYRQGFEGSEGARPLHASLEGPGDLQDAFAGDAGAHQRSIETMDNYIREISDRYVKAVQSVGTVNDLEEQLNASSQA